ncbi:hypothetical protein LCGC14_2721530 [marine sediment metagenome]|uniref:Uncharacterized protein n=1 Tax=marine sediment metagenome TaxID=412755 RepID=A0A0F8ZXL8_9ZZZZ
MVETNTPEYWNDLSKRGEVEDKVSSQVEIVKKIFPNRLTHYIF